MTPTDLSKKIENLALPMVKVCLAVAWAVLIFALLERPMPIVESDAKGFTVSDKFIHIFLFGILLWLVLKAVSAFRGHLTRLAYFWSVAGVFGFAYLCEYLQKFVPTRTSSLIDLSFGTLGIVLGLFLYKYWSTRNKSLGDKPKLLLHLCCGPCGAQISEELKKAYDVSLFFTNSNIDTKAEFDKRLKAVETLAQHYGLPLIVEDYDHQDWLAFIKEFEDSSASLSLAEEPERGRRCLLCYRYRLAKTAQTASAQGFAWFTTSLSVSPFKEGQAVLHLGKAEAQDNRVKFLDQHFGLAEGFKKATTKAKELGLYRQKYCGCEFSRVPWSKTLREKNT